MLMKLALRWSVVLILISVFISCPRALGQTPKARQAMAATVHPIATRAALDAFRDGGNAVDAAVAAALMLGVVDGHNSGLGGGCFALIRKANGELIALDGREMAPASATEDMFLQDGNAVPEWSKTGPLAIAVPGALAVYDHAIRSHGTSKLSELLSRAADVAETGFAVDRVFARNLRQTRTTLSKFAGSKQMLLKPDGSTYLEGELLRLPDLANSYREIASQGKDWFYQGEFAQRVGKWMSEHGGLLTADDFANYSMQTREPVVSNYRGFQVVGFPPPSSGGVHVAQMLNILEHFDMRTLLQKDEVTAHHVMIEAMKLAFVDRAHWLGDADFARVPRGLAGKEYAKELAKRIDVNRSTTVPGHGMPPNWESDVYGKHTTHIATADALGNWVAITATVNTSFGSKVVVPGTGIVLNNEMDDFSAQPGVPNAFGLVGAKANAVAPGKRPLSSMSPTILMKDGVPVLTVGAAGGPKIITQVLLAIVRFVDGKQPVEECVSAPRIHHQWRPDYVLAERSISPEIAAGLIRLGHRVEFLERSGICQAITQMPDKSFEGVADPRVPGQAAGL